MMMFFSICLLAAAVFSDVFIYRYFLKEGTCPRICRGIAAVAVSLPDVTVLAIPMLYTFLDNRNPVVMHVLMWCNFVFILVLLLKLFLVIGIFIDRRRGGMAYRIAGIVLGLACAAVMILGATVGRSVIRVERIQVRSSRLPEGFDGFRIVQFSDLHLGSLVNPGKFINRFADTIAVLQPDIIFNTGDLVNIRYTELTPEFVRQLSRIKAPHGVYSVLGNHDLGFYIKDTLALAPQQNVIHLVETQQAIGWQVLSDSSVCIYNAGDSILLTGLNFPQQARLHGHNSTLAGTDLNVVYRTVDSTLYNVVLAHAPQLWDELCRMRRGDLTLSGHVHAMQAKLHIFGREFSPAQIVYKQWSGRYDCDGRVLYINDGLGCVMYPMRIGARPEVTLIELIRCE